MPAIPIVIGAMATYGAAAGTAALLAGTLTLATVAAGATMLGGVLMIAGGLKGGKEGAKWIGQGSMLALVGSLGTAAAGSSAASTTGTAETGTTGAQAAEQSNAAAQAVSPGQGTLNPSDLTQTVQPSATLNDAVTAQGTTTGANTVNVATPLNVTNPTIATPNAVAAPDISNTATSVNAANPAVGQQAATTIQTPGLAPGSGLSGMTTPIPTTAPPTATATWNPAGAGSWVEKSVPNMSLTSPNGIATMAGQAAAGYAQGQSQQAGYETQQQMLAAQIAQQNNFSAARQYNPLLTATNK